MKYPIQATFEQIFAYRPDQPETHTPSPLVNAVAEVLYATKAIECVEVADQLGLDPISLRYAVRVETGLPLKEILQRYRLAQYNAFLADHADAKYSVDEVAQALGYANGKSISRFIRTQTGQTLRGRRSVADPDAYVRGRAEIRRKNRL